MCKNSNYNFSYNLSQIIIFVGLSLFMALARNSFPIIRITRTRHQIHIF